MTVMSSLPDKPEELGQKNFKSRALPVLVALCVVGTVVAIWTCTTGRRTHQATSDPVPVPGIKIPLRGYVSDFEFRPDGREILVIQQVSGDQNFVATILKFPDGAFVRSLTNVANGVGAWSPDGSQCAVGHSDGYSLDVWDTRSWRQERSLSVGFSENEKSVIGAVDFAAIAFDCDGNVYCAERVWGEGVPTALRVKAWWPGSIKAVGIASNEKPFDLAIACMRNLTRLAIAYDRPSNSVEIWRVRQESDGKRGAQREYQIPALHQARVALAKDGTTLVTQDESAVRIYHLFAEHADLTQTLAANLGHLSQLAFVKPVVSSDGAFAAFVCGVRRGSHSEARVVVVDIADGEILFESHRPANPIAFSPDSKLLAVCERGTILVYPVNGK
jgi:WD40 repeat protein